MGIRKTLASEAKGRWFDPSQPHHFRLNPLFCAASGLRRSQILQWKASYVQRADA
jgi:hypothetical protein